MHTRLRFSSLVLTAAVAWAALAGVFAVSNDGDAATSGSHTFADAFPIAQAGFAAHPVEPVR